MISFVKRRERVYQRRRKEINFVNLSEKEKDEEAEVYLILATFGKLVVSYKY